MAPVVSALASRQSVTQQILLTGQHGGLADAFPYVPVQELRADVRDKKVGQLRRLLTGAIGERLSFWRPDLVIVHGDTTSAVSGALAARACGIPVAHVEAGLRSHKRDPWPEESNRVAIDRIADLLLAPTEAAAANLAHEQGVSGSIYVTGNSGIDALFQARTGAGPAMANAPRKRILVTCHRRENRSEALARICVALKRLVAEMPVEIMFPLHLNRHKNAALTEALGGTDWITLLPPLEHGEMVRLIETSWLVLTDSGGLQEEGTALGRPVLVMRGETERTEAPANIALVGSQPAAILSAVHRLLMDEVHYARMSRPVLAFGDGLAAPRIAALIEDFVAARAG